MRLAAGIAISGLLASTALATTIPIQVEQPEGYAANPSPLATPMRQDFTSLTLRPTASGRYDVVLGPAEGAPVIPGVDLRTFVPRIPEIAKHDETLTRIALYQREFNRNDTKLGPVAGFEEAKLANNCLRSGLWEVMLDTKAGSGTAMAYHGWFTMPDSIYAQVFESVNGVPFSRHADILATFPDLTGLAVPLARLRRIESERAPARVATHHHAKVERLGEQSRKSKLLISSGVETYAHFVGAERQPLSLASFQEPGVYDKEKPVAFQIAWMGKPQDLVWRKVSAVANGTPLQELELRFENGNRLLLADATLAKLPALPAPPTKESEVLKLTFGIGTPEIYATAAERKLELESPRPNYLLLVDAQGRMIDNHKEAGIDRAYLWREAGDPGRVHVMLVSYERIAIVAHLSARWQPPAEAIETGRFRHDHE